MHAMEIAKEAQCVATVVARGDTNTGSARAGGVDWLLAELGVGSELVVKLKEFSIHRPVDRENTYLTRLLSDLERDFAMPLDNHPSNCFRPAIRDPITIMTRQAATPAAPRRGRLADGDMMTWTSTSTHTSI